MPLEEIIRELKKQDKIIDEAQQAKRNLYAQLDNADCEWISVQTASKLLGVSVGTIYNKINDGSLTVKNILSAKRVKKSEVLAINDISHE